MLSGEIDRGIVVGATVQTIALRRWLDKAQRKLRRTTGLRGEIEGADWEVGREPGRSPHTDGDRGLTCRGTVVAIVVVCGGLPRAAEGYAEDGGFSLHWQAVRFHT